MKVQELIEKLKLAPPDSVVGFAWFGTHVVGKVEIGKMPGQDTGYVLLYKENK